MYALVSDSVFEEEEDVYEDERCLPDRECLFLLLATLRSDEDDEEVDLFRLEELLR